MPTRRPASSFVARALGELSEVALEAGQAREALPLLERAVRVYDAHEGPQDSEVRHRLRLARTLTLAGSDPARARAEAAKAARIARQAGDLEGLAEAEALLKENADEVEKP